MKLRLPHQADRKFLTWTGFETDLIFNRGIDLPGFASFPLLRQNDTRDRLRQYAVDQIRLADRFGFGCILESVTWMANRDRAAPLGYDAAALREANLGAMALLAEARDLAGVGDVLLSANIGPRGDAYASEQGITAAQAEDYHSVQIASLRNAEVDLLSAYTLGICAEAIGITRAAQTAELPVVIAFTVETDGRLPNGRTLDDAIAEIDAATGTGAEYFMVNCAHPDHFRTALSQNPRLRGVVVNASRCSHKELNAAETLDDGDPEELGREVGDLLKRNPRIEVFGGCCGTDFRHLEAMARAVSNLR